MKYIPVSHKGRRLRAKVDDDWYTILSTMRWHAHNDKDMYPYTAKRPGCWPMHRIIMRPPPGMKVDHINGDVMDNRRENLRICTHTQNMWNSRRSILAKSGYTGVYFHPTLKNRPWQARITANGKVISLGYFATKLEASAARKEAEARLLGEFRPR